MEGKGGDSPSEGKGGEPSGGGDSTAVVSSSSSSAFGGAPQTGGAGSGGVWDMQRKAMLVQRLVGFAFKVLNVEMDGFFTRHYMSFDQDVEELQTGQGETLEQYEIFKEYEQELEVHMDKFCKQEGFSGPAEAFSVISEAVSADLVHHEQQRKELQRRWEQHLRNLRDHRDGTTGGSGVRAEVASVNSM